MKIYPIVSIGTKSTSSPHCWSTQSRCWHEKSHRRGLSHSKYARAGEICFASTYWTQPVRERCTRRASQYDMCWRSLTTNLDRQLLQKKEPKCGINARIDLFTNRFHRWCSRMCAGDFELILQHNGGFNPRHNVSTNQDATRVRIWSIGPTRARYRHDKR